MNFHRPLVMGVINLTPDSFSDGGEFLELEAAYAHAKELIAQGANILDLGGESTRPGALRVPLDIEQQRILPLIKKLVSDSAVANSKVQISVDTMNADTAVKAIKAGATIINDVSGGLADKEMFRALADSDCKTVISHWRGFSDQMDSLNNYQEVAKDVASELAARVREAEQAGISRERIIIDPGLGFAKDIEQNWHLVARLDELEKMELPILIGASRKRFVAAALYPVIEKVNNSRRDLATAVLTALLIQRKLWGIRVHNVEATVDAIKVVEALKFANDKAKGQS